MLKWLTILPASLNHPGYLPVAGKNSNCPPKDINLNFPTILSNIK